VTLNIQWRNRNEAADWANELVNRLNVEMRERAIRNASASVQYLEKELETTGTVATRDAISRLMEAQIKQRMLANVTTEYAFRIVDRAIPPDSDDVLRPRKMRLIALGAFLGMTLAALWVLVSGSLRPRAAGPNEV
jgi:LPS O-antigen subunit length determinant protein (WzzB/FepE family)